MSNFILNLESRDQSIQCSIHVYNCAKSTDTEERHKTNRISFQHKTFVVITHKDCDVTRKSLVKYIKETNSEQKDLSEELFYEKF